MRAVIALLLVGCAQPFAEDRDQRSPIERTESATLPTLPSCTVAPDSFAGIDGTFERAGPAPLGELQSLVLFAIETPRPQVISEANVVRRRECGLANCPLEPARASLLPEGTAMTPMILFRTETFDAFYEVQGIEREGGDERGKITALCMQRIDEVKTNEPFVMSRVRDAAR